MREVGAHAIAVADNTRDRQDPQQRVEAEVEREQDHRDRVEPHELARDRLDARRHHEREVRRVHPREARGRWRGLGHRLIKYRSRPRFNSTLGVTCQLSSM